MAKKRTRVKTKAKAKRSKTRRLDFSLQLLKILAGLSLLTLLVVSAGVLAHFFIRQPSEQTADQPPPVQRLPLPPVRTPQKPTYEVFPQHEAAPGRPLTKLEPLPGDRPPLVAIIIDDMGYDRQIAAQFLDLHVPLTLSLLPYGPFTRQIMDDAQGNGYEIMLHLPMEPNEYPQVDPGPGALFAHMSPDELIGQLKRDLDQLPGLKGVNNHMGSRLTTSPERMRQIFSILKKRNLYYIDSRTTAETVARSSAELLKIPFAERDIFIDHVNEPLFIRKQLGRLIKRAQHQGYAVGIAHPHANTHKVFMEMLPRLQKEVQLVPASMVIQAQMLAAASKPHTVR